jgi:hypothetical protein
MVQQHHSYYKQLSFYLPTRRPSLKQEHETISRHSRRPPNLAKNFKQTKCPQDVGPENKPGAWMALQGRRGQYVCCHSEAESRQLLLALMHRLARQIRA